MTTMHDAEYRIERVSLDEASIAAYADLLSRVFPEASFFTPEYLRWQYRDNPAGPIVGFNAYAPGDSAVAAHYVAQPFFATIDGTRRRGLLSLNTATHPEHQGRRLFTKLAMKTYETAASEGFEFVIGVANANSTPGFVGKLGFQLVGPLNAWVGIGDLHVEGDAKPSRYRRVWSDEELTWRLRSPRNRYDCANGRVYARTDVPLLEALIGAFPDLDDRGRTQGPFHLWLGLDPAVSKAKNRFYLPVPRKLRPSPLNLIYKPLGDVPQTLDACSVSFWAIDFDAY